MSTSEETLQVGDVLGFSYRVIARGTPLDIGTIYQAFDMKQGKVVSLLLLATSFEADNESLARLRRSGLAVADLAGGPLIPFEHVGLSEGCLYLIQGHAEGHTLTSLLARFRTLQAAEAAQVAFHVAGALAPLHLAGSVHGSLSSRSIIVTGDGQVAVTDAGLFPALRPASLAPHEPWGRHPYLAPEQAAGREPGPASDVYAIGLLIHEMLTGKLPYEANDPATLVSLLTGGEPLPPLSFPSEIPESLQKTVQRALATDPGERYRNAGQLANLLSLQVNSTPAAEQILAQKAGDMPVRRLVVPAPPIQHQQEPSPDDRHGGRRERTGVNWLIIGLIVATLIAVIALVSLSLSAYRRQPTPTSTPGPLSRRDTMPDPAAVERHPWQPIDIAQLEDSGFVWYNHSRQEQRARVDGCPEDIRDDRPIPGKGHTASGVDITVIWAFCGTL